jgi:tRNA(Ile)-lysidine synthase
MNNLKLKVAKFIRSQQLLSADGLHLVALSGGADSVALMLVLKALGYRIEAVHCNFHLRGEESDRDEQFVKRLSNRENIPLHLIHFDTREYAALHQVSIEMAARDLRYHYFSQLLEDIGADTVCVAHHRDDAVETLLMNLLRGAGIHGLTGIRPRNRHVVRPLLCVSRKEILLALKGIGQEYVTDSSNLETEVLRNKIRLQLIPLLEQLNPSASENIFRTTFFLSEAEKVYNANFKAPGNNLSISSLLEFPSPLSLLHEWLSPLGFNRTQMFEILESSISGTSGKEFNSSTHTLVIDRDTIFVEQIKPPMKPFIIPETGLYNIDETRSLRVSILNNSNDISREPYICTIDADKVKFPLTLRPVRQGDRFVPFGMNGTKLISDFLTDKKLPLIKKSHQLLVADVTGLIVWVVGLRTSNICRVTSSTSFILKIEIK